MRTYAPLLFAVLPCLTFAQDAPKNLTFATKLKSVAVFRDGFGYYVREGKVKLEDGWATTDMTPAAVQGSVWFYSLDPGDTIDTVVITKDNKVAFKDPKEIKAKLADKVGLKLIVATKSGQKFEGELARILDDMLLLKIGDAFNAVPYDQIQSISLSGYPVRVKVNTKQPNKVTTLGVAYLQDGIKWEPSYVLNISHGVGTLGLRASIQNTTEKLDNTEVFFVVGSPFVVNRGIDDMLSHIPGAATAIATGTKAAGAKTEPEADRDADQAPASARAAISRDEAGELFYYKKPELSLDSGDVAMISIYQSQVPITPRFEWNADGEEVNYLLSLKNKTGEPLTTGPVMVLEDGKALGQETVKYTAAGATTEIKIAQGIGIKVDKTEAETHRGAPTKIGNTEYIPVTLHGTLTISNFRSDPATMKVTRTLRGKVDELSDKGFTKQTQIINGEPNPINDVVWNIVVAPGATKTLSYTYEIYMSADRAGAPPVPVSDPDKD
ncbi:MAG TPA: hypothetical protein VG944_18175 [Fimbriimonas sp.]|nr:hypothetical protein [Fimbriimonas sp.]